MRFKVGAKVTALLRQGAETVELSERELAGLRELLPAATPQATEAVLRRLFASSFLEQDLPRVTAGQLAGCVLAPDVPLSLEFKMGDTFSQADLALALGCAPEVWAYVQGLTEELLASVRMVCSQSSALSIATPREQLRSLLERLVERSFAKHPELAERLVLERTPTQDLALRSKRAFGRASEEVSVDAARAGSGGYESTRALSAFIAASGVRASFALKDLPVVASMFAWFSQDERPAFNEAWLDSLGVQTLAAQLLAAKVLIPRTLRPISRLTFASSDAALSVLHMGHAGAVVDAGASRVLVDPFFCAHGSQFEQQPLLPSELGKIDAVLYTHHHRDHILTHALLGLPRDTPIVVPDEGDQPVRPRYRALFEALGFTRVLTLGAGESLELADGTWIDAVPFFGESRNLLGFGATLYAVSRHRRGVLFHADAAPDTDGASLLDGDVLEGLRKRRGNIDIIYGSWWQQHQIPLELCPLALLSTRLDSGHWLDAAEACAVTPSYVRALAERCGASLFMLYAELGDELFLPAGEEGPYLESISCSWLPLEQFKQEVESGLRVRMIRSVPRLVVHVPVAGEPYLDDRLIAPSRREQLRSAGISAHAPSEVAG